MIQPETWKVLGDGVRDTWAAVGPLFGVLIGAYAAGYWQRKHWIQDNRKQEWRELISTLSSSVHTILKYVPVGYGLVVLSGGQEKELLEADIEARRIIEDRIFIDREVKNENVLERWQLIAAEKGTSRMLEYWNDLHDTLVSAARKDLSFS